MYGIDRESSKYFGIISNILTQVNWMKKSLPLKEKSLSDPVRAIQTGAHRK